MNVEDRKRFRCHECQLVQFVASDRKCRRCHVAIDKPQEPVAAKPLVPDMVEAFPCEMVSGKVGSMDFWIPFVLWWLRRSQGMSERQLAAKMDVPRTYISKVENDCATPLIPSIFRFSDALEVSPSYIFRMTEFLVSGQ